MEVLITIIVLALMGSAFISASEASIIAVNRVRIKNLSDQGNKKAAAVQKTLEENEKFFGTLLLFGNLLNVLIADYAEKNNFDKCLVSLSGGIDSALVTVIACEAMGSENVKAVTLPSKYSSSHSISDSEELCENLGLDLEIIPIIIFKKPNKN